VQDEWLEVAEVGEFHGSEVEVAKVEVAEEGAEVDGLAVEGLKGVRPAGERVELAGEGL
jgi:hypothetical protein